MGSAIKEIYWVMSYSNTELWEVRGGISEEVRKEGWIQFSQENKENHFFFSE